MAKALSCRFRTGAYIRMLHSLVIPGARNGHRDESSQSGPAPAHHGYRDHVRDTQLSDLKNQEADSYRGGRRESRLAHVLCAEFGPKDAVAPP